MLNIQFTRWLNKKPYQILTIFLPNWISVQRMFLHSVFTIFGKKTQRYFDRFLGKVNNAFTWSHCVFCFRSSQIGWVRIILIGGFKYTPHRQKFAFHFSSADDATPLSTPPVQRKACKDAPYLHHSSCSRCPDAHQYHWKATWVQSAPGRNDGLSVSTGAGFQVLQKEMHVTLRAGRWSTRGEGSGTVV